MFCALAALLLLGITSADAATITKKNTTGNLNSKQSWIGNRVPGAFDVALWDSTITGANAASLGGNLSWLGLRITNPGGLVTIYSGGTLTLGSSGIDMSSATVNFNLNCAVVLGAAQSWNVASARTLAASNVISGTRALTKDGLGTITLTGVNTYSGGTTINAGTVAINDATGLGATTGAATINAGTLELLSGRTVSTARLFNLGSTASTFQVDSGSTLTLTGTVGNGATSGNLVKTGAGTLALTGANTFGGVGRSVLINGGTLQVSTDGNLGNAANSVSFDSGTLLFGGGFNSSRGIALNSGGGTINTNNNAATLSGAIGGSGSLTKAGAGTLTLTGTNTYTGGTFVTGGNASVLSISSGANVGSGAVNLSGGSVLLATGSFTFSNGLVLGATGGIARGDGKIVSGILNVGSGLTLTLSGVGISEVTSGTGRLEKFGAGTLIVNTANSYSGGTYIHDGTLVFGNALAFGPQPSNNPTFNQLTIDNGAQLKLSIGGAFRRDVLIGTGGGVFGATTASNIAYRNGVFSNVASQTGGVTVASGVNGFGGANTFTGNLTINNGAIAAVSRDANFGAAANQIFIDGGATLRIEDGIDITANSGTSATTVLATFATGRQITLGSGSATIEVKNFADTNSSFDVSSSNPIVPPGGRPAAHQNTFTINGQLTGAGNLIKSGDGTLVLANAGNNYTGTTTINGGILSVSDPAALGSGNASLTINPGGIFQATGSFTSSRAVVLGGTGGPNSGGTFDVTGSNVMTRTGVISGSGSLIKIGTGTLVLDAANTFTGDLYLNGGTLITPTALSLGPQPVPGSSLGATHMANGTTIQTAANSTNGWRQIEFVSGFATLNSAAASTQQRNGLLYGAGGLIKAGAGTLVVTNANTYSGGTTINSGTLQVNNASGSGTGSGAVTVNSGGTLSALPTGNGFALAGSVAGGVTVNGGGGLLTRSGYTFNLGGLTLNGSAVTNFQLGAPTNVALINITNPNAFTLGGLSTVNIANYAGGLAAGTYRLFDYSGTALSSIANLQLGSTPGGGFTYWLSNNTTNTSIDLLVSLSNQQWANDTSGNWNLASNWTNGIPNAVGAQANFFSSIQTARSVSVDGAFTIGSISFNNAHAYTIAASGVAGHGLTLNNGGAASIFTLGGAHTISAPLTLADHLAITAVAGAGLTISGNVGESVAERTVTVEGAGAVTFAGGTANGYTGLTQVSNGTLNLGKSAGVNAIGAGGIQIDVGGTVALLASNQIADAAVANVNGIFALGAFSETIGALKGGGNVSLGAGSILTIGSSNGLSSQFDGTISGGGSLTKAGAGTFILSGTNTFGGAGQTITLGAGTLQIGSDSNLGNTANSLTFSGGKLAFSSALSSARAIALNSGGVLDTNNNAVTLSGAISGSGSLTKTGAGALTLAGNNSYTGGTLIGGANSILRVSSDSNLGATTTASLDAGVTLSGGGTLETATSLTTNRKIRLGLVGGSPRPDGNSVSGIINVAAGTTLTLSGQIIGDSNSRLEKSGAGILFLNNTSTSARNSFGSLYLHGGLTITATGVSQFNSATLTVDNGAGLISNQTGAYVTPIHIGNGGHLRQTGLGFSLFRNGLIDNVAGQSGGLTFTGDETAAGGAAANAGKQGLGGTNTFVGGVVIGTNFTLSISRDANLGDATNQLTINGGTLAIEDGVMGASPTSAGSAIAATFSSNRTIQLLGNAIINVQNTFDALANPGAAGLAAHTNTLTLGGLLTGSGSLTKNGPGTLVLTNAANDYTGGTIINGGMLSVGDGASLGTTAGSLTINNNATFQVTGNLNTSRATILGGSGGPAGTGGGVFDVAGSFNELRSGVISGAGSLTKTGIGTLSLTADNSYTGGTFVNAGIVAIDRSASLGHASAAATIGDASLEVLNDVSTTRNFGLTSSNSTFVVDDGATFGVSGVVSGSGALNKTGEGTIALLGPNTYSGGTTIHGGTVVVNSANSLGGASGGLTINSGTLRASTTFSTTRNIALASANSTIAVENAQTYSVSGVVSGSGALNKTGAGTLNLTTANTFSGGTVVDEGTVTLSAASGSALANTSAVTVNAGGTLLLGASNQINNNAGVTLDGGTFAKGNHSEGSASTVGIGALTLTAANSRLDFGSGTVGILNFASFNPGENLDVLLIANWTGLANTIGSAASDRLIFNSSQASNLAYFSFSGYDGATQFDLGNGFYEVAPVTPVPEPATYLAGALAVAALAVNQRRRLRRMMSRAR